MFAQPNESVFLMRDSLPEQFALVQFSQVVRCLSSMAGIFSYYGFYRVTFARHLHAAPYNDDVRMLIHTKTGKPGLFTFAA